MVRLLQTWRGATPWVAVGLLLLAGTPPPVCHALPYFCPACPLIAAGIVGGGVSTESMLSMVPAIAASLPFTFAFWDGLWPKNMTFVHPAAAPDPAAGGALVGVDAYRAGSVVPVHFTSHGLGSFWHLGTSELFLLNATLHQVEEGPILSAPEFDVVFANMSAAAIPLDGVGRMNWTIPVDLPTGVYHLRYVSGWTIWRHEQKFTKISPPFTIVNPAAPTLPADASLQLAHMPPLVPRRRSTFLDATEQVGLGVLDVYAGAMRDAVSAVLHPGRTWRAWREAVHHPLRTRDALLGVWEGTFEQNAYRATGQVLGTTLFAGQALTAMGEPLHVVRVTDIACTACIKPIGQSLLQTPGVTRFSHRMLGQGEAELYISSRLPRARLEELITETGGAIRDASSSAAGA